MRPVLPLLLVCVVVFPSDSQSQHAGPGSESNVGPEEAKENNKFLETTLLFYLVERDLLPFGVVFTLLSKAQCRIFVGTMMKYIATYAIHPVGSLLTILFTVSLVWCGDAECWSGSSDDQCASLICSLFANHNGSSKDESGTRSDCACDCHVPTIVQHTCDTSYYPPVVNAGIDVVKSSLSAPPRPVYHPPLAA